MIHEEWLKRLVPALLTAIIGSVTTLAIKNSDVEQMSQNVERVTRESQNRLSMINGLETRYSKLQTEHKSLYEQHSRLEGEHNVLKQKYQKCVSSDNAKYRQSSFDFQKSYKRQLRTNDILEFGTISSPLLIKVKRVSQRGPVIEISGCEYYLTENGIRSTSDGHHSFYLLQNSPLEIKYSVKSCTYGNAYLVENEIEIIRLVAESFNTEEQTAFINYYRTLYKK